MAYLRCARMIISSSVIRPTSILRLTIAATSSPSRVSGTATAAASRTAGCAWSASSIVMQCWNIYKLSEVHQRVWKTYNVLSPCSILLSQSLGRNNCWTHHGWLCPSLQWKIIVFGNSSAIITHAPLSTIYKKPSSSTYPRSPDLNHPSGVIAFSVAAETNLWSKQQLQLVIQRTRVSVVFCHEVGSSSTPFT